MERGRKRERAREREGELKVKEIKKQKKQRESWAENKRDQRKGKRETEKEIDGRRNIHEGTHKRRQTETLQLHDHVFAETTRNRKGQFGWKGPVGQNRETSMCVCCVWSGVWRG